MKSLVIPLLSLAPLVQERPRAQPPITFRVEVSYIEVDALVVDAEGRFASGLTKDDFEILEGGKPQEIASFSAVDLPVVQDKTDLGEPVPRSDVASNESGTGGRIYVILMDDLHTAALRSAPVKKAARRFVAENLGDTDLAAVIHTSGRADATQGFTTNRRLLTDAVDKFIGKKLPSATSVTISAESVAAEGEDLREDERGNDALTALRTLRGIADSLSRVHGRRKALVYFSEGIDFDIEAPMKKRHAGAILAETTAAMGSANRANVSFYSIDSRGLNLEDDVVSMTYSPSPDSNLGIQSTREEVRRAQASLRSLSDETGGFAVVNQNEVGNGLKRIVRENSQYYLLGYYPTNEKRDGKYRKIEVRVKRPGLSVRARKGYVAPKGDSDTPKKLDAPGVASPLLEVLSSPIPVSTVPLRAVAITSRGSAGRGRVAALVEVGIGAFRFTERDGKLHDEVNFGFILTDRRGKVVSSKGRTANLSVPPAVHQRLLADGFRVLTTADLEPGVYQLAVAVNETGSGLSGSLYCDVEVPDSKSALRFEGVVLSSAREAQVPVMASAEDRAGLVAMPTTRREFRRDDELIVVADLAYGGRSEVDVTTLLRGTGGTVFHQSSEEKSVKDLGKGESFIHQARISLKDVPPGEYVLELKATDRSQKLEALHAIPLSVVGDAAH